MSKLIQSYIAKEKLVDVRPKTLMPVLIENGFFEKDQKEGLPLRNVLRDLYDRNELHLIPQVRADKKVKNISWFFNVSKH